MIDRPRPLIALVIVLSLGGVARAATGSDHARALHVLAQSAGLLPDDGGPIKCGLPLIAYARQHRTDGGPGLLSALKVLDLRPALQTSLLAGRFRIHFDTTGINTPAMLNSSHTDTLSNTWREYVDSVASAAAWVYHVEVESLAYDPPPPDGMNGGGPEYDLYIMNLGAAGFPGTYGFTSPDTDVVVDGGRASTFIVMDNTFRFLSNAANRGVPALDVTVAHEFHHAIQIGSYAFWASEVYFHEMTSVWMEAVNYPAVDDYIQYVRSSSGHFANPDLPFNSNAMVMYSRGIWGHFLAKRFGADAMRHSWEETRQMRPLPAIDAALMTYYKSGFAAAFADWALWNYFTGTRSDSISYYPSGARYPLIAEQTFAYSGGFRSIPGSPATLSPLASAYFNVTGGSQPLDLITANVDLASAEAGSLGGEQFNYAIGPAAPDAGYRGTTAGIFVKFVAADRSHWWTWDVVNGIVGATPFNETMPFPNPFVAGGGSRVYIASAELEGELAIFSSSMDLMYKASQSSTLRLGRRVFSWDGTCDDGRQAGSGIYVYVLSVSGRTVTGKFALIRNR